MSSPCSVWCLLLGPPDVYLVLNPHAPEKPSRIGSMLFERDIGRNSRRLLVLQHETVEITDLGDGVITVRLVQQAPVVPYDRVARPPLVAVFEARLS